MNSVTKEEPKRKVIVMEYEIVEVSPAIAEKWLSEASESNFRKPNLRRVAIYANDMKLGHWEENGETIKFQNDILIDGQHRMLAIVKSGVTIPMIVVRGVSGTVHIDTGQPRRVAQVLSHLGYAQTSTLCATIAFVLTYEMRGAEGLSNNSGHSISGNIPTDDYISYASRHGKEIIKLISRLTQARKTVGSAATMTSVLWLAKARAGDVWTNAYADALTTGENLTNESPLYHLRERIFAARRLQSKKLDRRQVRAGFILTWNAFIQCSSMRKYPIWRSDTMKFPEVTVIDEEIMDAWL